MAPVRLLRLARSRRVTTLVAVALALAAIPIAIIWTTGPLTARAGLRPSVSDVAGPLAALAALVALQQALGPSPAWATG